MRMQHGTDNPELRYRPPSHERFCKDYLSEISLLARLSKRPDFAALLQCLSDHSAYLSECAAAPVTSAALTREAGAQQGIDPLSTRNAQLRTAFAIAHLAACCHLLHDSSLSLNQLRGDQLLALARQFLEASRHKPDEFRARIVGKLHAMDTMRSVQLLRNLGLFTRPTSELLQLGLGCGEGNRDLLFMHLAPRITLTRHGGDTLYRLSTTHETTPDSVIVDVDSRHREQFQSLEQNTELNVRAYNLPTPEALDTLRGEGRPPRNLVTGFRIDHRMLPDVREFLSRLTPCLDTEADLIFTIGAGDTPEDFEGRTRTFRTLHRELTLAGLQPLLFKLHGPGSPARQRHSLKVGNLGASSYQILYCSLIRERLETGLKS
ncbi:MAG: hypothetical protein CMN57_00300 [Gammaproteobacteria bacterium]|nr:hypothetical protein [Gammaproteobacteria bacterium]